MEPRQYANFRILSDRVECVPSLYLCQLKVQKLYKNGNGRLNWVGFAANIALKPNIKLGRYRLAPNAVPQLTTNHSIYNNLQTLFPHPHQFQDTLILGADVTHPGRAVFGAPSILAVVGNMRSSSGQFGGSARWQQGRVEVSIQCQNSIIKIKADIPQMIQELQSMVVERVQARSECNGGKALKNILYFRDGVSDPQYDEVETDELPQITAALAQFCEGKSTATFEPNITAIITTNRHHTRFFPTTNSPFRHHNGNCRSGTCVDNTVTKGGMNKGFFLQSHLGTQGTAKPTYYYVVRDDMQFNLQNLENLVHHFCYTYARAAVGVSYATPAYHADRLCDHVRVSFRSFFDRTEREPPTHHLNGQPMTPDQRCQDTDRRFAAEWRRFVTSGPNNQWKNPWHKNSKDVMFWL